MPVTSHFGEASTRWARAGTYEPDRSLFTPVQVVRSPRAQGCMVEIVTRTGCVVRVHGPVDEDTLGVVLGALGSC